METIYEIQRIKQVVKEDELINAEVIRSPDDCADIARSYIGDEDREVFLVLCLNTKNRVVAIHRCHVGSINANILIREKYLSQQYLIMQHLLSLVISTQVGTLHRAKRIFMSLEDLWNLVRC